MSDTHLHRASRLFADNPVPEPREAPVKTLLRDMFDEPRWVRLRDGRMFYQTGWVLLPGAGRKRRYAAVGFSRVEYVRADQVIEEASE